MKEIKKIKMGLIGGSKGSLIGKTHYLAAEMDGMIELVCGAFSSDPKRSKESAGDYKIPENRAYGSFQEMIRVEKTLPEVQRMDFVAITTPNNLHYEAACLALENGFHVLCDKPLTYSLEEAEKLVVLAKKSGLVFAVTYTYTGYPMVKEARRLIKEGALGTIRKVMVEYTQGWLSRLVETEGNKQALWRTDPKLSGKSCTVADIGVHAQNLAEYVSGLEIAELCADMSIFVKGRKLDDDGNALLRFSNGAKGVLISSQACTGEQNALKIMVYGDKGGLEWQQPDSDKLILKWPDKPQEILSVGDSRLSEMARAHARGIENRPDRHIEAFANIYRNFALAIDNYNTGKPNNPFYDFPTATDGLRGMQFIEKMIDSSASDKKWLNL